MDKKKDTGAIAVFVNTLPDTPGWAKLTRKKQDELLQHTSNIQQNRQLQSLGEFGELMELHHVQTLLEGEEMRMVDYLMRLYPDRHRRTIDRKREVFGEMVSRIPPHVMKKLTTIGSDLLNRFDRIASAALGDIRNAVRELPALTNGSDKAAEQYLEQLDAKLIEHRRARRKSNPAKRDEEMAAKMAANGLSYHMRACGLATSAQKRAWLKQVFGWTLEVNAIPGAITVSRISIPGGVLIPRGRPRKNPKKEAA